MQIVVSQKGSREHFLAARALHRRGMLALLVVDWYAPSNPVFKYCIKLFSGLMGGRGRSALATYSEELPDHLIRVNLWTGLIGKMIQRSGRSVKNSYDHSLRADIAFSKGVAHLSLPPHNVFFGYSYMMLESIQIEKNAGVLTILDQIDPGPTEFKIVANEMKDHPAVAGDPIPFPTEYYDRLRKEWELTDVIVVNSEWSRESLISEGVNSNKIQVLPLAYEPAKVVAQTRRPSRNREAKLPLRVLWLGQVNVRKGIHYLIEAARILAAEKVHFEVVGPVGILPSAVLSSPSNIIFHGPVSRDMAEEWYAKSDLFVLPTLSDGFALTQLEALAHGLPVITTSNCGRVVDNGKTGFIVPARDSVALADAIMKFVKSPNLAFEMEEQCRKSSKEYSVEAYGRRLEEIIHQYSKAL